MNPEELKNKLILHLRVNKLDNTGIFPPILLYELLINKQFVNCRLKQGFISMNNEGHCWHLWIENGEEEEEIDINQDIARHLNDYFKLINFDLTTEPPKKYDKDETNVCQWELYNEDKNKFWKEQPMKYRNFRAKVLNKIFKDC
jgi:hypothetical protein